jgi:glucose/arabinose dehydrogenase
MRPFATSLASALLGSALLVGCAAGDDVTASPEPDQSSVTSARASATPTPATPSPTAPAPVQIEVALAAGTVTPPPSRVAVPLGSPVELTVTSDVADEIHVHGYELEEAVAAGGSVTIRFTADQAGLFDVETHETEKFLTQLQVS